MHSIDTFLEAQICVVQKSKRHTLDFYIADLSDYYRVN